MKNSDPNASVAGGSTGVGVLVVWLLGRYGVDLSAEVGAAIAGGAATILLVIGRRGIKGTLQRIWSGSGK